MYFIKLELLIYNQYSIFTSHSWISDKWQHRYIIYLHISRCFGSCNHSVAKWQEHSTSVFLLRIEEQFDSRAALVIVGINVKHENRLYIQLIQTENSFREFSIIMIFMNFQFTQITQAWVHYFKLFSRVKSTQNEKVRFTKGNELKVTQIELYPFFIFNRVQSVKDEKRNSNTISSRNYHKKIWLVPLNRELCIFSPY